MTLLRRSSRRDAASWPLGVGIEPRGVELRVPYDRVCWVIGPQGSGKSLDALAWAAITAPGALLQTSTKAADVLLTYPARTAAGRPVAVCDPYGDLPGLPPVYWDLLAGCVKSKIAERRARAFAGGTVQGGAQKYGSDDAARFYAAEATKVLQGYFHAAALTGRTIDDVMTWVANPTGDQTAFTILQQHPHAEPHWAGFLQASVHSSNRETVSNTVATVQQAMSVFMHAEIRRRCMPGPGRPATDLAALIRAGGTIYLLGKDDPYGGVSSLLTAITEDVLDTVEQLGVASPHGRLSPPFMACIDEWPNIAPIPSMPQRQADWRGRGGSIVCAAQDYRQIVTQYGEDLAASMRSKTNVLVVFGGSKDIAFLRDVSDLLGTYETERYTHSYGAGGTSRQASLEDRPTMKPFEIARIPPRHALVVAETAPPILARMRRVLDGRTGAKLTAQITQLRDQINAARAAETDVHKLTRDALAVAAAKGLHADAHRGLS